MTAHDWQPIESAPKKRGRWILVPIREPLDLRTIWEHTPLDYYRYGEYPRFVRPVGAHQPRSRREWKPLPEPPAE